MRKIVAGLMVSVDGVVEAPEEWTGQSFSPETGQVIGSVMAAGDTMLVGRVTYQTFAASFAGNTRTLICGDVAREIARLKEQPGKNINISGSPTLVTWLLRQGLLDELSLLLFPVVVGRGKRLFDGEGSPAALTLAHCEAFSTGVVHLTYHAISA